jgi:hypothetical protein
MAERVKADPTLQALQFQPGLAFIGGGFARALSRDCDFAAISALYELPHGCRSPFSPTGR